MQNAIRTGVDIVELHQIVEEMNRNPDFAYDLLTKDEMKLTRLWSRLPSRASLPAVWPPRKPS